MTIACFQSLLVFYLQYFQPHYCTFPWNETKLLFTKEVVLNKKVTQLLFYTRLKYFIKNGD